MKICLLFIAPLFFLNANAQKDTSLRKTSIAICNCLEKKNMGALKSEADMQAVFLKCITDSAMDAFSAIIAESDGDTYKAGKDLGEKIALDLLAMGCKPFVTMSLKLAGGKEEETATASKPKKETEAASKSLVGDVIKVEEKDFLYITVKAESGREHVLIYLQYVPSSDSWIKEPLRLKGKKVKVTWKEYEVYQTKIKEFSNIKELKELDIMVKDAPVK